MSFAHISVTLFSLRAHSGFLEGWDELLTFLPAVFYFSHKLAPMHAAQRQASMCGLHWMPYECTYVYIIRTPCLNGMRVCNLFACLRVCVCNKFLQQFMPIFVFSCVGQLWSVGHFSYLMQRPHRSHLFVRTYFVDLVLGLHAG